MRRPLPLGAILLNVASVRSPALALLALALFLAMIGRAQPAEAHPLGNFTINHYDRIDVTPEGIEIFSVLDMAEIPTVRERQAIDTDGDGEISAAEYDAYEQSAAAALRNNLTLRVNGDEVALREVSRALIFSTGDAELLVLRLEVVHAADLPGDWRDSPPSIEFEDTNYGDRIGWREIIVRAGPGVELADSSVPSEDVSYALTAYPDGFGSPLDVRTATFSVRPGAGAPLPAIDPNHETATRGNPDGTLQRYASLVSKNDLGLGVVLLALLAAMGFGAIHALSPGHGKTIVAAYLVGSRGTWKHALLLGLTVTATHTSSVYAIGFITLYFSDYILPEDLYPWLGVSAGVIVLVMGLALFWGRLRHSGLLRDAVRWLRTRRPAPAPLRVRADASLSPAMAMAAVGALAAPHSHREGTHTHDADVGEDHHDHDEDGDHDPDADDDGMHSHGFGPAHSHRIPGQDGEPVTWQRLVGLGMFGGMIPCPSAIVVMLAAVSEHRVGFGLLLILAFSIGLAGVLTGIGFALVFAGALRKRVPALGRLAHRVDTSDGWQKLAMRAFPVAAAAAVVVAGIVITARALLDF